MVLNVFSSSSSPGKGRQKCLHTSTTKENRQNAQNVYMYLPPGGKKKKNEQFLPFQSCVPRGGKIDKNVSFSVLFLAGEKKEKKGQFHPFFHSCSQWAEGWKKTNISSFFQSFSQWGREGKKSPVFSPVPT